MTHTVRNRLFGLLSRQGAEADSSCHPRRLPATTRPSSAPAICHPWQGNDELVPGAQPSAVAAAGSTAEGAFLDAPPSALGTPCLALAQALAGPPEADQAGDQGDEEDLANHHLQAGEHPAWLAAWDEIPVSG